MSQGTTMTTGAASKCQVNQDIRLMHSKLTEKLGVSPKSEIGLENARGKANNEPPTGDSYNPFWAKSGGWFMV